MWLGREEEWNYTYPASPLQLVLESPLLILLISILLSSPSIGVQSQIRVFEDIVSHYLE
jgi:hypothetical protein